MEHLGKGTRSLSPWHADSGGQVQAMVSSQTVPSLNLAGIPGLNSSKRQTLDRPEGVSGLKNFAVGDTGGQQARETVQGGQGWPCQFWNEAEVGHS